MERDNNVASEFVKENFGSQIDELLLKTANLLREAGVPMSTAREIAKQEKQVALICFWAGVDYAHLDSL